tara:strand:+ start:98 stop:517 length:420 start_codon:yes stop_codon:yes gene_type:complete
MSGHNVLQSIAKTTELEILDPGVSGTIAVDRSFGICNVNSTNVTGGGSRILASPARTGIVITVNFQSKATNNLEITGANSDTAVDGSGDPIATKIGSIDGTQYVKMTCAHAGDTVSFISTKLGSDLIWNILANNGGALS